MGRQGRSWVGGGWTARARARRLRSDVPARPRPCPTSSRFSRSPPSPVRATRRAPPATRRPRPRSPPRRTARSRATRRCENARPATAVPARTRSRRDGGIPWRLFARTGFPSPPRADSATRRGPRPARRRRIDGESVDASIATASTRPTRGPRRTPDTPVMRPAGRATSPSSTARGGTSSTPRTPPTRRTGDARPVTAPRRRTPRRRRSRRRARPPPEEPRASPATSRIRTSRGGDPPRTGGGASPASTATSMPRAPRHRSRGARPATRGSRRSSSSPRAICSARGA